MAGISLNKRDHQVVRECGHTLIKWVGCRFPHLITIKVNRPRNKTTIHLILITSRAMHFIFYIYGCETVHILLVFISKYTRFLTISLIFITECMSLLSLCKHINADIYWKQQQ